MNYCTDFIYFFNDIHSILCRQKQNGNIHVSKNGNLNADDMKIISCYNPNIHTCVLDNSMVYITRILSKSPKGVCKK